VYDDDVGGVRVQPRLETAASGSFGRPDGTLLDRRVGDPGVRRAVELVEGARHAVGAKEGLADLGFCKIAGSELIVRYSALRTPFHDAHPNGQDVPDTVAETKQEERFMQERKKFQGVVP
jgi:hypothetical protein